MDMGILEGMTIDRYLGTVFTPVMNCFWSKTVRVLFASTSLGYYKNN